jgi:hypothetical protein
MRKALLGATIIAGLASPAYASDHMRIVKCDSARNWKECAIITLKGELLVPDADEFVERTNEIRMARVDLSGPGGNLISAINIGEQLHLKGYNTYVPANSICFSACSLLYIGKPFILEVSLYRRCGRPALAIYHSSTFFCSIRHFINIFSEPVTFLHKRACRSGARCLGQVAARFGLSFPHRRRTSADLVDSRPSSSL